MQKNGGAIVFSAGDLVGHLNCRYLTHLDLKVVQGELAKPRLRDDPTLDALVERGKIHEQGFVDHLAEQGATATVIAGVGIDQVSVTQTQQAMVRGDAVIVQAALRDGHWGGRADVLRRVETPSGLDELRRAMTAIGFTPPETGASNPAAFDDMQKLSPHFFRKGRTGAWREDMPRELHLLFWRRHGETMRALGYRDDEPAPQEFAGTPLDVRETLTFAVDGTGCAALGDGWGEPEGWGTWSVDRRASLRIAVGRKRLFPLEVDLSYRSFVDGDRTLEIICRAAGKQISSWTCSPIGWRGVQRIAIPPEAVTTEGTVELDFEMSAPKSPAELGLSLDTRQLGIGIESMRLRRA
jgi:hypothetical protein